MPQEVLVDTKLNMGEPSGSGAKEKGVLGYIQESIASRSREVILLLGSALGGSHLECCVQFCPPQYRRDMGLLERDKGHQGDGRTEASFLGVM